MTDHRPSFSQIQALRAVAALLVVLFHLRIVEARFGDGEPLLPGAMRFADAGVDMFFVISGFVMATVAVVAGALAFLQERHSPLFLLAWAVAVLVAHAALAAGRLWQMSGFNQSAWQHLAFIVLTVAACLVAGLVSWRWLERPLLALPASWRRQVTKSEAADDCSATSATARLQPLG